MSTRKNGALLAAAALISFGSMLLRPTGVRPWRSLWAEDGRDFLTGGLNHPPVIGWFRSYQGYQHVIPRMIGSLAALFPLDRAADVFAFASAGIAAVALVLFAVNLRPWLPATWMQATLIMTLALAHATTGEVSGNAANLHWFLTLALIGLILSRSERKATAVAAGILALLFALSDPFSVILGAVAAVLLAIHYVWCRIDRAPVGAWAGIALGGMVQVITESLAPRAAPLGTALPLDVIRSRYASDVLHNGIASMPSILPLTLLIFGALVWISLMRPMQWTRVILAAVFAFGTVGQWWLDVGVNRVIANRYQALSVWLLLAEVLILCAVNRILFLAGAVVLVALELMALPVVFDRGRGSDWPDAVHQAERHCRSGVVAVPIPPHRPWAAVVPCD